MKKVLLLSLALLALASCAKDVAVNDNLNSEGIAKVFTCSLENDVTKVYVDDQSRLYWDEGDLVSIFTSGLNEQYRFLGKTGDIGGDFEKLAASSFGTGSPMPTNVAVYPYYEGTKVDYDGNVSLTLPSVQTYRRGSFGPGANLMVAVTEDADDYFLPFKNACGYLSIKLFGQNVCVKTITFRGNNGEPLTGKATIKASHTELPELTIAADGGKEIVLDCGSGVTIGKNKNEAVTFWIVVPPMTFTKGFTFTIEAVNGEVFEKSSAKEQTVKRNICKDMSPVQINSAYEATKVTEVSLDQSEIYFTESGQQIQLHATVYPDDATNKRVFWTSFDESVATVDEDGVVTAVGNGETTITVTTEDGDKTAQARARVDWEPPVIESIVFSSTTLDVTESPKTLTIDVRITDLSGVDDNWSFVMWSWKYPDINGSRTLLSGDDKDGTYRLTFDLPTDTPPDDWFVSIRGLKDINGYRHTAISSGSELGVVTIINENDVDIDPPVIESIVFSSTTLDVTESPKTLTIDVRITDLSGVDDNWSFVMWSWTYPDINGSRTLLSGDDKDGTYRLTFDLPTDTPPDNWFVSIRGLQDINGYRHTSNSSGSDLGVVTIINENDVDIDPPVIESIVFSSTTLDVTESPKTLTVDVRITDKSGVDDNWSFVMWSWTYPDINGSRTLLSGDDKDGTYRLTFDLPTDTPPDNWFVSIRGLQDINGYRHTSNSSGSELGVVTVVNDK